MSRPVDHKNKINP